MMLWSEGRPAMLAARLYGDNSKVERRTMRWSASGLGGEMHRYAFGGKRFRIRNPASHHDHPLRPLRICTLKRNSQKPS